MTESFRQQVEDQKTQVENLKTALLKLQQKLAEAESKSDMLIAQHRRSRALGKATDAGRAIGDKSNAAAFDRMKNKVQHSEAAAQAKSELSADNVDDKFAAHGEAGRDRAFVERDQVQAQRPDNRSLWSRLSIACKSYSISIARRRCIGPTPASSPASISASTCNSANF